MKYSWQKDQYGEEISWNSLDYDPAKHGSVTAIRIFFEDSCTRNPMAELAFAFGGTCVIEWDTATLRARFEKGINGYTLMSDTRITDTEEVLKELDYRIRQQIRKASHV